MCGLDVATIVLSTFAAVMATLALPPVFKRVVVPILERIWK